MPQFNLNQLRLKNFRAFSELTKINFGSRITLIFGKGSVGKSTIIDAINILSSSYKNKTNLLDNTNRFHLSKKTKLIEPKNNGLTMKQMMAYFKKSKGNNKIYWRGRTDAFRGSLRYQDWLETKTQK